MPFRRWSVGHVSTPVEDPWSDYITCPCVTPYTSEPGTDSDFFGPLLLCLRMFREHVVVCDRGHVSTISVPSDLSVGPSPKTRPILGPTRRDLFVAKINLGFDDKGDVSYFGGSSQVK